MAGLNQLECTVVNCLAHTEVIGVDDNAYFAQDFTFSPERDSSAAFGDDYVASTEKSQWTPGKFLHQG